MQDTPPFLPVSLAAALARLVDKRARVAREAVGLERFGPNGDVLIWLDHPMPNSGLVTSGGGDVIVAMHSHRQAR